MKNLFFLATLVFLTSFSNLPESKTLPNGKYAVVLDQKYKESGMNEYEVVIYDSLLVMTSLGTVENFALTWMDDNSFIVPGITEPKNPTSFQQERIKSYRALYIITKKDGDSYSFKLGTKDDPVPIYTGRFVKIK